MTPPPTGRFAPTPSGPLHAGSLVAALASWLDVRARGGRWLVRIEDLDTPRNAAGAIEAILGQLARCGLAPDAPPRLQSTRRERYRAAIVTLLSDGSAYRCGCTRRDLSLAAVVDDDRPGAAAPCGRERIYPGTCRGGLDGRPARSVRLRTDDAGVVSWIDRRLGARSEDVAATVGDFVLERADGIFAYQLAVVVDDAADRVTDIVRGEDLAANTARQIVLQRKLGVSMPRYLHVPLVRDADGRKLSKQTGAVAIAVDTPRLALESVRAAGTVLGVASAACTLPDWLAAATAEWKDRWTTPAGPATID